MALNAASWTGSSHNAPPHIVLIGGSLQPNSSTEKALAVAARHAESLGADVTFLRGADLDLPFYNPNPASRTDKALRFVEALRQADGVIIASPGYHGAISGLVKNALDYAEDLRTNHRAYLDNCAVGCIGLAGGWQGATAALTSLRSIVHALRGWPTPLGVVINTMEKVFDPSGGCTVPAIERNIHTMTEQVIDHVRTRRSVTERAA